MSFVLFSFQVLYHFHLSHQEALMESEILRNGARLCISVGFSGTPNNGAPYPYYSHTTPMFESLKIWEWYGKLSIRVSHVLGSFPGINLDFCSRFWSKRLYPWQRLVSWSPNHWQSRQPVIYIYFLIPPGKAVERKKEWSFFHGK